MEVRLVRTRKTYPFLSLPFKEVQYIKDTQLLLGRNWSNKENPLELN